MKTKLKTLLGALLVLAVLAAAYFAAGAWQNKKAAEMMAALDPWGAESIPLTNFDVSQVTRIEVAASTSLILEKINDNWQAVTPFALVRESIDIDQSIVSGRLWAIANFRAGRVIEEQAKDISPYGLDTPFARAVIGDSSGSRVELIFGNVTPDKNSCYVMRADDPKIYTVYLWAAENLLFSLNDIRAKELLPNFDPFSMSRFIVENAGQKIEVEAMRTDSLVSAFSRFVLVSPYRFPRGAASERFGNIQLTLGGLAIGEFIDDEPESLVPYGLNNPGRLYVESPECSLDLLFGAGADGRLYAKLAGKPGVFTVPDLPGVVNVRAFDIFDKYIVIFHIDMVQDFIVEGEGRVIKAAIRGTTEKPEFFINGKKAAEAEFRTYYQWVISLQAEAEYPNPQDAGNAAAGGEDSGVTITFNLKGEPGTTETPGSVRERNISVSALLLPYNRDFYSVTQGGAAEFLVSRSQVRRIFDSADKLVFIE